MKIFILLYARHRVSTYILRTAFTSGGQSKHSVVNSPDYHSCIAGLHTTQQTMIAQSSSLDPLTLSAADAQSLLKNGKVTSIELVEMYLDQIERHNLKGLRLRAVLSVLERSKAIETAQQLDLEREKSGARGPMHGIPILVKVCFARWDSQV